MATTLMNADEWAPYLRDGETIVWSGSGLVFHDLPIISLGMVFFALIGLWFAHTAFTYDHMEQFCGANHWHGCAKFFFFRWPGAVICLGSVLCMPLIMIAEAFGWLRHNHALTDRRALSITQASWRTNPPKLAETDLFKEKLFIWHGLLRFGSAIISVSFSGLTEDERDSVLSLVNQLTRAQQP